MKLSHAVRYALQALVYMANETDGQLVASHVVAEAEGIPELFLLKVLKMLVSARILQSLKGPSGAWGWAGESAGAGAALRARRAASRRLSRSR